jgi:amidase
MAEIPRNASVGSVPASSSGAMTASVFRYVVKDCIDVKGCPTSCGASPPITKCAVRDAEIVTVLNARGGRLVAKTNLDELSLGCLGENRHFGRVANPRYPDHVCGGSSSGSAAMVAAGLVELGVGSDWGGSIRIPALCCGVYGLKLRTHPRFLRGVEYVDPTMGAIGFLSSSLEFLSEVISFIELEDRADETDMCGAAVSALEPHSIDPDTVRRHGELIRSILERGTALREVALPWSETKSCRTVLAARAVREFVARHSLSEPALPEQAQALLRLSNTEEFDRLVEKAERDRKRIQQVVYEVMEESPLIVCPGLGVAVPRVGDAGAIQRFSDSCTYFFEIANVADVSSLVFPAGALGDGAQLLIRPGWEGAALRWLRGLRIAESAPI